MARRSEWSENQKLGNLLSFIEGQEGEFVFSPLPPHILDGYQELTAEMNSRYRVIETSRLFAVSTTNGLKNLGRRSRSTPLKRLNDKAHKRRDRATRVGDLVQSFFEGLVYQDARFEVEYHKEPKDIDEAVYHMVNWYTHPKSL